MRNVMGVVALACVLAACATNGPALPEPVLCVSKAQCDAMWSRAQVFVTIKAGYPVTLVSDSIIQTAGPRSDSTGLAITLTRESASDGSGMIRFSSKCANYFGGCVPSPTAAGRDFYGYLAVVK